MSAKSRAAAKTANRKATAVAFEPTPPLVSRRVAVLVTIAAAICFLLAFGFGFWRANLAPNTPATVAGYPGALSGAADKLAALTGAGGQGYDFDVVHHQVEVQRPGGPLVQVGGGDNPSASPTFVARYYVLGAMEQGGVTPGGLYMELRTGLPEGAAFDFSQGTFFMSFIQSAGVLYRNDGAGWYRITGAPGLGFDPVSAARLPLLLRTMVSVSDLGLKDGLHGYSGMADVADWPGIVAADALPYTSNPITVTAWLDSQGRLVRLEGQALNLADTTEDLQIDATVSFTYPAASVTLPIPSPAASGATP